MKSLIEIRRYAVDAAIAVMGVGTPQKDIVAKAKEIETYIVGSATLPETTDETAAISSLVNSLLPAFDVATTKRKA